MSSADDLPGLARPASPAALKADGSHHVWERVVPAGLLVLLVAVCLTTFRDYGATWDEDTQASYAAQLDRWYRTWGRDDIATRGALVREYGGLFEVVAYQFTERLRLGQFESRHLANVLFGLIGIIFAYRLARLLGGTAAGLVGAGFLTLTPVYYGHMFANPKDIPFAALYLVAVDAICRLQRSYPAVSWWRVVGVGAAIGSCMAVRVGGIVLFGLLGLAVAIAEWSRPRNGGGTDRWRPAVAWPAAGRVLLVAPVLSWILMCAFWPYAWISPIAHPLQALRDFSRYPWGGGVLFNGTFVPARELPWDYIPTWLAVSLPDFLLVAAALGVAGWVLGVRRRIASPSRPGLAVVLVSGVAPLAAPIVMGSTLYDGLRHVLFCLPPLITVVAVLYAELVAGAHRQLVAAALLVPVASGMLVTAVDMVELHPYQYVYFNRLAGGGLAGAHERFDTDYWCASIKEGVDWTVGNVPAAPGRPVRIASGCPAFLTEYYLRRDPRADGRFTSVPAEAAPAGGADIYISVTRERKHERVPGVVLHRVERQGAPLCYVIAVRPPAAASEDRARSPGRR